MEGNLGLNESEEGRRVEGTGERTVSLRMRMRKKADGGGGALSGQQFAFRGRLGVHGFSKR